MAARAAALFLLAALASPAAAQGTPPSSDPHVYVGGTTGPARWSSTCSNCDSDDTALRVFGGYQINRIVAAEIGFANFGETRAPGFTVKGNAWDASLVASWPVARVVSVHGRAGVHRANLKGGGTLTGQQHDKYGLTYGFGAEVHLTPNVGLRFDYQEYSSAGGSGIPDTDIRLLSAGALWRFR